MMVTPTHRHARVRRTGAVVVVVVAVTRVVVRRSFKGFSMTLNLVRARVTFKRLIIVAPIGGQRHHHHQLQNRR